VIGTDDTSLLAKQKANLSRAASSASLMSRIAKGTGTASPARKVQQQVQARKVSTAASARTARTKAAANKAPKAGGMDIDQPPSGSSRSNGNGAAADKKGKGKVGKEAPNQAALDEEMRLYERQKRFAA
jgi:hypothetical protein